MADKSEGQSTGGFNLLDYKLPDLLRRTVLGLPSQASLAIVDGRFCVDFGKPIYIGVPGRYDLIGDILRSDIQLSAEMRETIADLVGHIPPNKGRGRPLSDPSSDPRRVAAVMRVIELVDHGDENGVSYTRDEAIRRIANGEYRVSEATLLKEYGRYRKALALRHE